MLFHSIGYYEYKNSANHIVNKKKKQQELSKTYAVKTI